MSHAKVNSIKSNTSVVDYLKPDLESYAPELYFEYDEKTHRYIPNTDITNATKREQIQFMIDNVLFLNHGAVKNERRNFINLIKQ